MSKNKLMNYLVMASALFSGGMAVAAQYNINKDASLLSIITHKDGIGQSFAHNHLIHTSQFQSELTLSAAQIESGSFNVKFDVNSLILDDPQYKETWRPLVDRFEILDEPFGEMTNTNRISARNSMLGEKQLDAANYPAMTASAGSFRKNPLYPANSPFTHLGELTLTIRNTTVRKIVPLIITFSNDEREVEVISTVKMQFTDFGIEPFSAFLGAVKNKNRFDILVHFKASIVE